MEEKEDKGFVVKDRRKVSMDEADEEPGLDEGKEQTKEEEAGARARAKFEEASRRGQARSNMPLPGVTFYTFVFSLSSSAMVHLGDIPQPNSEGTEVDLPMAKQIIDTLGMLEEKTRGNLTTDEDRLLKTALYDLRMRFVQKSGRAG